MTWNEENTLRKNKKDIWKLEEKLIPCTEDTIERACNYNDLKNTSFSLRDFILTPLEDLPKEYLNLYDSEVIELYRNDTLYDIMTEVISNTQSICFLSEADENEIEGFACYSVNRLNNKVLNIEVFSLRPDGSSFVLARDMVRLLNELESKYKSIQFSCTENQPVLKHYIKEVEKRNGTWDYDEDDGLYYFYIGEN